MRIFTPTRELPFAGHPTLGTAWVLGRDMESYTLDIPAERVQVTFEAGGIAWMQPPPVEPGSMLSSHSTHARKPSSARLFSCWQQLSWR